MIDVIRQRRVAEEALLLALHFHDVDFDDRDARWVMIRRFPLPPGLCRPVCALLFALPPAYPSVPPRGVFLDRDLGLPLHFLPERGPSNPYADDGWGWLCLLQDREQQGSWSPRRTITGGDNLLVLATLVRALIDSMT